MLSKLKAYAPTQMISALSVFAVLAAHTHYLKIGQYGSLALILACVEIVRLFTGQWINSTFIRFYSHASGESKKDIENFSLQMMATLLLPALIVFAFIKILYAPLSQSSLTMVFLLLCTKTYFLYFQQLTRLNEQKVAYQITSTMQAITSVALTIGVLNYWPSIDAALLAIILSYAISILFLKPKIRFKITSIYGKSNFIYFKYGMPLVWTGLIFGLISRVDKFIIFELMDAYAVGLYSAVAAMLAGLTSLGFMLVALPLYPEVVKWVQDRKKLQDAHAKYLAILMAATLPILIFLCFVSEPLTQILLGKQYTAVSGVSFILLALSAYILNLKAHYVDHGLQFILKTGVTPYIAAFGLVINILTGYGLIKLYGLLGASMAAFMTTLSLLGATWYLAIKNDYTFFISLCCKKIIACNAIYFIILAVLKVVINVQNPVFELMTFGVSSIIFYAFLIILLNPFDIRVILRDFMITVRR